jgi:hypothetical protein
MREIIGGLLVGLIMAFPTIRFYQRCNWRKRQNLTATLAILFLWFLIQSPLHELSHLIGAKLIGVNVVDYQLIPKYWTGDFVNAWVRSEWTTSFKEFVITISPYLRDLIIVVIGFLILKTKRIHNCFVVGLIFSLFLLNSVFDIVSNFLGYVVFKFGDWNGISKLIGHFRTYFFGIAIMAFTIFLTYRIYVIYKGFPEKTKDE